MGQPEGQRLRLLLEVLGYTQTEAAELLGGAQSSFPRWYKLEALTASMRVRAANLTAAPDLARWWLLNGGGMPAALAKRAAAGHRHIAEPARTTLNRVIVSLDSALGDLRELAGGIPPLTLDEAGLAANEAGGGSPKAKRRPKRAG